MATSRAFRVVVAITTALFLYQFYLIFASSDDINKEEPSVLSNIPGKWHDPNTDLIEEPPGLLRRVDGDNYAANNLKSERINAAIISLVRNSELEGMLQSMRDLESTFNSKFNYPWIFFNDVPFDAKFKKAVRKETQAEVRFELVPPEHWETPPWINKQLYDESTRILHEHDVQYADKISYHRMCRWNSGMFAHHPALANMDYYWRVEPDVHFFCEIDYDVFRFLADRNMTYGFTINLYDAPASIPGLWPATQAFLADPANARAVHPRAAHAWLVDREHRPHHHDAAHGYSTCHFWSNFEIGRLAFWRDEPYASFFAHLDRAGGFFYERWGDAPVHSIALGLFEDRDKIHWFRDIGYQHIPFFNCPRRLPGRCSGCETGRLTDGEKFLYKEDCRPSWFDNVGMGVWAEQDDGV